MARVGRSRRLTLTPAGAASGSRRTGLAPSPDPWRMSERDLETVRERLAASVAAKQAFVDACGAGLVQAAVEQTPPVQAALETLRACAKISAAASSR